MEVCVKFAAPTFAGGASKKVAPTGNTQNPWGRRKEVNIGAVGMGLIGSAPQKPYGVPHSSENGPSSPLS